MDIYADFSEFYDVYVGDWLEDLPFYLEYARRSSGPILEVGAGSGRLTIPFARKGVAVTAVDISASMLAKLRSRLTEEPAEVQQQVSIVEDDACTMELNRRYELIIVPFYTFNYLLTPQMQTAALGQLVKHLSRTGRLLIDVFVPHSRIRSCPRDPCQRVDTVDQQTGCKIRGWNVYRMDTENQIEFRKHVFEVTNPKGKITKREFTTKRRYFFKPELDKLFVQHGLIVDAVYEGYDKRPASDLSEQLMYVLMRC